MLTLSRYAPRGPTIRGFADLRARESDRIQAIVTKLRCLRMEIEEYLDGFAFQSKKSLIHAKCDGFGDHRTALAFGIAGLTLEGETVIENAGMRGYLVPHTLESSRTPSGASDLGESRDGKCSTGRCEESL